MEHQQQGMNQEHEGGGLERLSTFSFQAELDKINALKKACSSYVIGQPELINKLIICLISDGHALLEGVPGIAKTLTAKILAKTLQSEFSRIQFTPDLMPSDIIGTSIFNQNEASFSFKRGPIFSNFVLIDEINRAPAKTQAALFEVMEEKQISFDGVRYEMPEPFFVVATQNPIEQEGTYRLPEAQLDRFIMKINIDYPGMSDEIMIMKRYENQVGPLKLDQIDAILSREDLKRLKEISANITIEDDMIEYVAKLVQDTRNNPQLYLGASPRASMSIMRASKTAALLEGRSFVIPDDVQYVAKEILNHRVILSPDSEMAGRSSMQIIDEIMRNQEVPR